MPPTSLITQKRCRDHFGGGEADRIFPHESKVGHLGLSFARSIMVSSPQPYCLRRFAGGVNWHFVPCKRLRLSRSPEYLNEEIVSSKKIAIG
jgi:hypothetical protein